jgi:endonuclease/exonuclease/phosphatase family metal-dependent hydrolase
MAKLSKPLFVITLALAVFSIRVSAADSEKASPLKVMSFNIRLDTPVDPMRWSERQHLVVDVVKKTDPDVIGTQEGMYHQLKDVARGLPDYEWIGLGREGGSRSEFMAIYYRKARLEPMVFDHFWLSDTPEVMNSTTWGNKVKRMVTWVQFKDLKNGNRFFLVNTHFDHQVQPAREKSAELLRARIEKLDPAIPVIVTGDFNCTTNNPAYHTLMADGFLKDSWYTARERKGEGLGTFNGFKAIQQNDSRIDWILFRGSVDVEKAEIVTWSKDGNFPSDHCPMLVNLKIGAGL